MLSSAHFLTRNRLSQTGAGRGVFDAAELVHASLVDASWRSQMAPVTLISSDSHVDMSHDTVKSFLATKFHTEYDRALAQHRGGLETNGGRSRANLGEHWFREGHVDAHAHLADMDTDGVSAEVVYCEVSGFRYLYLLRDGAFEATRAFNDTLHAYADADQTADRVVSDPHS